MPGTEGLCLGHLCSPVPPRRVMSVPWSSGGRRRSQVISSPFADSHFILCFWGLSPCLNKQPCHVNFSREQIFREEKSRQGQLSGPVMCSSGPTSPDADSKQVPLSAPLCQSTQMPGPQVLGCPGSCFPLALSCVACKWQLSFIIYISSTSSLLFLSSKEAFTPLIQFSLLLLLSPLLSFMDFIFLPHFQSFQKRFSNKEYQWMRTD